MRLSPVQRRNERRRGKGGRSLANRTGVGRVAEIVVEIEAGRTARLLSSELFGRGCELASTELRQRSPSRLVIVG